MRSLPALTLLLSSLAPMAFAEVPQVVTDIPAVQSLTAQVMGDLGTPVILLDQGSNAHSYQLRPSQAKALQQADLVVWIGPEMTPWLDRALNGIDGAGGRLGLLAAEPTLRRDFPMTEDDDHDHAEGDDHDHAGDDDHDHAEDDDHDHDSAPHSHSGTDPHAWLDPENAKIWLGLIAADLAALDPEHATSYERNAEAARVRIDALETEIASLLAPVADRPFVVFHQAYGYFTGRFGLNVVGAINLGDATAPGAAHLTELRNDLAQSGAVCAFPEAVHDPKPAALLIEGTSVRLGGALDPAGSLLAYGPDLYAALLRGMAATISDCLSQG